MNMKKIICLVVTVSILLLMCDIRVTASDNENTNVSITDDSGDNTQEINGFDESIHGEILEEGACGENAEYKLYEDEMLYIFGSGSITGEDRWTSRFSKKSISNVYVDDGITNIGSSAFDECKDIKTIRLPDGIKEFEYSAFRHCESLHEINFPDSMEQIGEYAFFDCDSLTEIKISNGIKTIEKYTFSCCSNLKTIIFPESLERIEEYAFAVCVSLEEIVLPENLEFIGESSFTTCASLKSIIIPNKVSTIDSNAFVSCYKLEKILIPDNVTKIRNDAFLNCGSSYGTKFVIYCNENSEAERYALENEIDYKPVSDWDKENEEFEIQNIFNTCKGSPINLSIVCSESDEFTFECKDNCDIVTKYAGYSSITAGAYSSYSKNYELTFGASGEHIISVYRNETFLEYDKVIVSENHIWNTGIIEKNQTCTESGEKKFTCTNCNASYTEELPAIGHEYIEEIIPATSTEGEKKKFTCTNCNTSYIENIFATDEPEQTKTPESTLKPEQTKEPESTLKPEQTGEPEATLKPEQTKEPEATLKPEQTKTPQVTLETESNKLGKPAIKKLKNIKGKKVTITLSEGVPNAIGYQVAYSTKSSMKGKKIKSFKNTRMTIKKLKKKKTYYFYVRAYMKVNGKIVYGDWGKKKKIKIKK